MGKVLQEDKAYRSTAKVMGLVLTGQQHLVLIILKKTNKSTASKPRQGLISESEFLQNQLTRALPMR